ncbi:EIN3-binding F-box protein 1-like protein [Tanacetum coccineum]
MQNLTKCSVSNKITFDLLPSECLFKILRRVSDGQERYSCGLVSKKWLMLLSTIHRDEQKKAEEFDKSGGSLTRCLKGKKATDVRLAAIGLGTPASRRGLGELSVLGNDASKVTDFGLKAVARCSPSRTSLTLWTLSSVGDEGVAEIANNCHLLEKLNVCECSAVTDNSLIAIANNCPNLTLLALESCSSIGNQCLQAIGERCSNLKSISIKNCPLVGDKGIASLVSSTACSLMKISLNGLNISDASLAVIGHYGISLTDLSLSSLHNVTEKGFWVMGNDPRILV